MAAPVRYLTAGEMARLRTPGCEGCGKCCRGMGDTICLDPPDVVRLSRAVGRNFAALLEDGTLGLHAEDGLILPHMAMDPGTGACRLLGADGRCGQHAARPALCRLYPLGRAYTEEGLRYFMTDHECPDGVRTKVRIRDWLGIPSLERYEDFLCSWHTLVGRQKRLCAKAQAAGRTDWVRRRNLRLLETFYLSLPDGEDDFYTYYEQCLRERPWAAAGGDR